jgi:hypothetical protein
MALSTYMEIYHPEVDIGAMTYWEIGDLESSLIFVGAQQYIPEIYSRIIQEEVM